MNSIKCNKPSERFKLNLIGTMQEIDSLRDNPCEYISRFVQGLKNEVELKRDAIKAQIDAEAEEILKKFANFETECKLNLKAAEFLTKANEFDEKIKTTRSELNQWINELNKSIAWKKLIRMKGFAIHADLQSKLVALKNELTMNQVVQIQEPDESPEFIEMVTSKISTRYTFNLGSHEII